MLSIIDANHIENRYGYAKEKTEYGEKILAKDLPHDDAIALLTYDLDLLFEAVYERRAAGRSYYLPPDEIAIILNSKDYQMQCRIIDHCVDYINDNPELAEIHS